MIKAGIKDPIASPARRRRLYRGRRARRVTIPVEEQYASAASRPGHGPVCRTERQRAADHGRDRHGPAIRATGESGRDRRMSAPSEKLGAHRPALALCLRRRHRRVRGHARRRHIGSPTRTTQFLLDVHLRSLRLGDGVRAYQTPEGTCVVFGDFLTHARRADEDRSRREEGRAAGPSRKSTGYRSTAAAGSRNIRQNQENMASGSHPRNCPRAGASMRQRSRTGSESRSSRGPNGSALDS